MRLERVDFERLRGGSGPFTLRDLSPGLNLILGPNGSGKSSLRAALRAVLWPDAGAVGGAELVSWWRVAPGDADRGLLRAEMQALGRVGRPHVEWQRDGAPADPPALPKDHLARVYAIGLADLLADDHPTDRELARRLRVEMSGGFDLSRLRGVPGARYGHAQESAVREAEAARARLELERRELAGEDDRLEALRARLEGAAAAQLSLESLGAAAERARLRERVALCDERLAALTAPLDVLEVLRGDEREQLEAIAAERAEIDGECTSARLALTDAEAEREALGLRAGPPDPGAVTSLRALSRALREAESEKAAVQDSLARARHAHAAAARALAGEVEPEVLSGLGVDAIDAAAGWALRSVRLVTERARLEEAMDRDLPGERPQEIETRIEAARRGADVLREWLSSPPARPRSARVVDALLGVFGVGLAAAAVFAAPLVLPVGPWLLPAASTLLLGSLLARLLQSRSGSITRAEIERRWRDLPQVDGPGAWAEALDFEADAVRERLAELETAATDLRLRHAEAIAAEERRRQRAVLDREAAELAADRSALAHRIGVDPGLGEAALADLLDRVRRYREAELELERASGLADDKSVDRAALCAELEDALSKWSARASAGTEAAGVLLDACADLLSRAERLEALDRSIAQTRRQLDAASARGERLSDRRAALLARGGLSPDTDDERALTALDALERDRVVYDDVCRELVSARERIRELELQLKDRPELLRLGRAEAVERLDAARERAAEVGPLADEIARIEERVRAAARSGELEIAGERVERAEGALRDAREALALDLAGDFLLDDVEAEYERSTQPALLRIASEWFSRFTRHRYRLEVIEGDAGGAFRAIESETGRGLAPGELSDGTRMQALLAARLAFAIHAEGAEPLPIFLDEALVASDPERFGAVAEALLELVGDGRQIFYLTCDPADVVQFEHLAERLGASAPRVIDLAEQRALGTSIRDRAELRPPQRSVPPPPGDDDAETYALRLVVPRPSPHDPVDRLHLLHVLRDDLPLLHRLMAEARIERVGHWRLLRASAAAAELLSDEERARVDAAVRVAELYVDGLRIGRGRPVDREVLEATGAVSETFIDRLSALAGRVGGSARGLIEALEAKALPGYRTRQLEKLRAALEDSGHLDPAPVLAGDALRAQVVAGVFAGSEEARRVLGLEGAHRLIDGLEALFRPDDGAVGHPPDPDPS